MTLPRPSTRAAAYARRAIVLLTLLAAATVLPAQEREAARLHAQNLYWSKQFGDARAAYTAAIARYPDDIWLRIDYARMLAELGDLTQARTLSRRTLQLAPKRPLALRQLAEIAAATAPWISAGGDLASDNQPLVRTDLELKGGFTLTPNLWLTGQASIGQLRSADSLEHGITTISAAASHYAAALRLETELAAGIFTHANAASTEWTGRARIGLRLPRHLTLRAIAQRDPYLYTVASARTLVMTQTGTALVALATPNGWLGEAALQRVSFPDDNSVSNRWGWLMLPLRWTAQTKLRAGYGISFENAEESRWVAADPNRSVPANDPTFIAPGVYAPYFTPSRLVTHSLLLALEQRAGRSTMRLGGSYGVYATDLAPLLRAPAAAQPGNPRALNREFVARQFTPWTVRGGLEFAPSSNVTVGLSGTVLRTVFYTQGSARAVLTYRFARTP